ncbi:type IX secretion system sortase PorU [Lutibacter sp.]|uniref:type IX secretion system sortase PorU n=1 Tax=Lutibacter sp. TaxID=1925666 RepID=UPI0035656B59
MKKYKIYFIALFIFGLNSLWAQKNVSKSFLLEWNDNVSFAISISNTTKTSLITNNTLNEDLIPTFNQTWSVDKGVEVSSFSVTNAVYESIPFSENQFVKNFKFSNELDVQLNVVNQRDESNIILNVIPYIFEGNVIKRLKSFNLNYNLSQVSNKNLKDAVVENSVLATGSWYKFAVDTTGVFKIDKSFLQKLGVDTKNLNPKTIRIFGNGGGLLPVLNSGTRAADLQENGIYVSGEADLKFDSDDYILFYAIGPHVWEKDTASKYNSRHKYNIYSEKAYYFLNVGDEQGKRIESQSAITSTTSNQITTFNDFVFFEQDLINLYSAGQQWLGDTFGVETTRSYSIPFENINELEPIFVRVRSVASSGLTSSMSVSVNSQSFSTISFPAISGLTDAIGVESSNTVSASGNSVKVALYYNNGGNPTARAYLDYIEIIGSKKLKASGSQFSFRNFDVANNTGLYEYSIENSNQIYQVWNVTDFLNPKIISNQSSNSNFTFKVNGGTLEEYIALNENDYFKPTVIESNAIANQNLHQLKNIDYLVVTSKTLESQAQRLADYHSENSNLISKVVTIDEIYNEFASGSPDLTGIRDFIKHLYDNATTNKIKYVCLFGDASYDYKDRIGGNTNIVPVVEAYDSFNLASSYVTDDFYGMMDSNEGDLSSYNRQDIATGRIPVSNVLEAQQVVDKLLQYYGKKSYGDWNSNITLIADDIDATGEETLQINMEKIADTIANRKPLFNLNKIYLDAYKQVTTSGGNKYPTVNTDIVNTIESGTVMVNYFGHGGENGWASESVFNVSEIKELTNEYKLPLFVTVTCEFSRFDNPGHSTAGEYLLWNSEGGASSLISTTREIYISVGQSFNEALVKNLLNFSGEDNTIAEALMKTKNSFSTSQRYFIYMIGDPAMKMKLPTVDIKLKTMNGVAMEQSKDTIKALSYVKFTGEVTNNLGEVLNDFNGELDVTVFDKEIIKETLDNDNKNITMQFDVIESKIFKGKSKVENGQFEFDFVTPKDIKIAYGKGKLSFYATDNVINKGGYNADITIGGINTDAPEDSQGPTIQLYMNDLSFIDGGNTNESPLFIAVLEDENGINTSITAIDHDIIAILDGDESNPIVLNDYYETELNTYKKGKVSYLFKNLEPGLHTITLKAWDTYNNYSESTFTFFVVDDSELVLTNVLNYPNPFVNYTEFWFNHNKPNELLNVQVQIFTVSGKLVKTINESVITEGGLCRSLVWNGLDDFGSKIGKGVYVYKLKVKAVTSNISAQKVEKLVILQ